MRTWLLSSIVVGSLGLTPGATLAAPPLQSSLQSPKPAPAVQTANPDWPTEGM